MSLCDVLRAKTTDDLAAYLAGLQAMETAWLSPEQQHEEAWFLGLRLNAGRVIAALEDEFGRAMVQPALQLVARLADDGLVSFDGNTVRLTAQGRLLSNEVFQEFLGMAAERLQQNSAISLAEEPGEHRLADVRFEMH
jgi:oxygen-independent coproporphyrinogen-3 oxidase